MRQVQNFYEVNAHQPELTLKFVAVQRGIVDPNKTNGYFVACTKCSNTIRYCGNVTIFSPASIVGNHAYGRRVDNG